MNQGQFQVNHKEENGEKKWGKPYTLNTNAAIMDCSFYLAQPKKPGKPSSMTWRQ